MTYKKDESKALSLELVEIDHHEFAIEVVSGTVRGNLTQMAKSFGAKPDAWLKTQASKDYLLALSVSKIFDTDSKSKSNIFDLLSDKMTTEKLIVVNHGGSVSTKGTWANHHNIIIEFARWLSPSFSIEVNELIFKLLSKQAVIAEPFNGVDPLIHGDKSWYYYRDVLRSIGYSISSGSATTRKKKNGEHFLKMFGRNFIDLVYCQQLKEEASKYGIQLELDFKL